VGETGGKDFIVAHPSADPAAVATAIVRGAFEYQGQKCSAASRVYAPQGPLAGGRGVLLEQLDAIKMGPVEDFQLRERRHRPAARSRRSPATSTAPKNADGVEVVAGGTYDDARASTSSPPSSAATTRATRRWRRSCSGRWPRVYVYADSMSFEEVLDLVDTTSPYALTGAVFADDRKAVAQAASGPPDAAGNFYINDKPTGAVVGQQPFGGARGSGTNDKAGSYVNLLRWTSLRAIKETFVPRYHLTRGPTPRRTSLRSSWGSRSSDTQSRDPNNPRLVRSETKSQIPASELPLPSIPKERDLVPELMA
jgi:1-pyrroline-5-carboxylate dehydrogenase